ncbi:serine/threonine-protein kinase [Myxococcaceae bacterium GXIMD 01537]
MNPQSFGKYQLLKKLATGGMAEVWLARQAGIEGFQKNVVVKRILPHLAEDREFVEMFRNEALIAARFNHPNIAQIYEFGEANGTYYIAMEYIHGEDLGRVMRKAWGAQQWIAQPLALRIVAAACEGLHYAHTRTDDAGRPLKVVHRDISPQNILISFDGSVKLVDFGIAKAADQSSQTKSGAIKGKFAYMAPEQAAGKPLDARADIFAIGLVLYELLTGVRPLKRESELGTLQAALECKFDAPSLVADVPADLDPIVMRALTKAADDRYRDARQFQVALEDLLVRNQWVASSVQISELMETLFADRLQEENKAGQPMPSADEASGLSAPGRPASPPPEKPRARAAAPAEPPPPADAPRSRSSQSVRSSPSTTGRPNGPNGQRSIAEELQQWEEASGIQVRRTGEQPRRATGTAQPRTGSRTEMEAANPPPRRTLSRQGVPESDAPAPRSSTRGSLAVNARARSMEVPEVDDDEKTLLPEDLEPPPRRRTGQMPQPEPRRRTASRVSVPQPEPEDDEVEESVSGARAPAKKPQRASSNGPANKRMPVIVLGTVGLLMALGIALYREPLMRALSSSAADRNAIFVSVTANQRVQVFVRHTERCGMPGVVAGLGDAPLERAPGAHVLDTLILENRQQGIHDEIELPAGPVGQIHAFSREYKLGSVRLKVTPRAVPDLEIVRDGQVLGILQEGLKIELVEGKHSLELHSPQLSQPVPVEVVVKAGAMTEVRADLSKALQ